MFYSLFITASYTNRVVIEGVVLVAKIRTRSMRRTNMVPVKVKLIEQMDTSGPPANRFEKTSALRSVCTTGTEKIFFREHLETFYFRDHTTIFRTNYSPTFFQLLERKRSIRLCLEDRVLSKTLSVSLLLAICCDHENIVAIIIYRPFKL